MISKLSEMSIKVMNFDQVVEEYQHLTALPGLTDEQADRLEAILELAIANEDLNQKLEKLDHWIAEDQGLLNETDRESYQDQQALLSEHAGEPIRRKGAVLKPQDIDDRVERRTTGRSCQQSHSPFEPNRR
ncbi:MAG: hypothetical protein DCF22_24370 [Leptolyngbya sp.]|nr:MAG: hypothetical protein DCF22_24370 [Leptolyngbya sp.]